ncbi:MAG: LbtU family siderophore porin, partial [Desulfococcaceae bacterium]
DEGFVTLDGGDVFPGYLVGGKMYIPFGGYETHFVTDPNTLVLGETGEGAILAGVVLGDDMVDLSVGAYNGRAKEAGDDDSIDSFVAAAVAAPTDFLAVGVSYTSNLGGSDSLSEVLTAPEELDSMVGGWCAFATVTLADRITLIGEYLGAIDDFKSGELYAEDDGKERRPAAWNVELGVAILDNLEVAGRYGGADDGGADFLPETQYGGVINWGLFDNTNLALEYMHGDFEDDFQEEDTFTAQLAVEF